MRCSRQARWIRVAAARGEPSLPLHCLSAPASRSLREPVLENLRCPARAGSMRTTSARYRRLPTRAMRPRRPPCTLSTLMPFSSFPCRTPRAGETASSPSAPPVTRAYTRYRPGRPGCRRGTSSSLPATVTGRAPAASPWRARAPHGPTSSRARPAAALPCSSLCPCARDSCTSSESIASGPAGQSGQSPRTPSARRRESSERTLSFRAVTFGP